MRVLGRVRLSVDNEESTSIERQREHIEEWARREGAVITGWAEDRDVSGKVDPFETPDLGPWLQHPKQDQWDIMVARDQDRITRGGVLDLAPVLKWLDRNGKHLAFTHETTDTRRMTMGDRIQMWIKAEVAAEERGKMVQRQIDSQKKLREKGRYRGGVIPFGYQKVKRGTDGWFLVPHPENAEMLRSLIEKYINGASLNTLANEMNDGGIPTPRDTVNKKTGERSKWAAASLAVLFRSRSMLGQQVHNGRVVTGDDGAPVLRATEAIVDEGTYRRLQDRLDGRSAQPRTMSRNPRVLLDVLFCRACGSKMYYGRKVKLRKRTKDTIVHGYWKCSGKTHKRNGCTVPSLPAAGMEEFILGLAKMRIGSYPRTERRYVPAEGPAEQLAETEESIRRLKGESDRGLVEDEEEYYSRLTVLIGRRKTLQAMPSNPARYERVPVGGTWGEAIDQSEDKRAILLEMGFRFEIDTEGFAVYADATQEMIPEFTDTGTIELTLLEKGDWEAEFRAPIST